MRIALVSQEYPPETAKGGLGSQTYLKAHGMAALGHVVHVISQTKKCEPIEQPDGNVQVTRIPGFYHRLNIWTQPVEWLTWSAEVAVAVASLHERTPLDIVDFPEWGAEGYVHLLNQTPDNRIPTAIHLHGPLVMFAQTMGWPELDSEFYRIGADMERTCIRLADAIFSSSRCSAEWCAEHYDKRCANAPIIHTGIDTKAFRPLPVEKHARPTIIFVGRITRNKGVETLLDAACRLAPEFPRLRLRMIGNGEPGLINELKVKAAQFPDLLELPGFIERERLAEELSRAHVFAAPSIYEGGPGFVYLEAMACGLPVIGCEGSGVTEVIAHSETGFLVPPGDVEKLTAELRELLADEKKREAIGNRARRYVEEKAERGECLKRLEAFYKSVAGK